MYTQWLKKDEAMNQGADPSQPVPSLDEEAWMSAAISGTVPTTLAPNYAGLPAAWKMTQAEWDALAVE